MKNCFCQLRVFLACQCDKVVFKVSFNVFTFIFISIINEDGGGWKDRIGSVHGR